MIAADENLMAIRQVAKPVEEIQSLAFLPDHTEIAGMNHDIGLMNRAAEAARFSF